MAMTLVSTVTVGSGGAANIEWTGIAGTGKDLLVVLSGRSSATGTTRLRLQMNGQTSGYASRVLEGSGSSAYSFSESSAVHIAGGIIPTSSQTTNTFSNHAYYISNYTSTSTKSISVDAVTENNATAAEQTLTAASSSITSAITQVTLFAESGNLVQHSTASLYIIS